MSPTASSRAELAVPATAVGPSRRRPDRCARLQDSEDFFFLFFFFFPESSFLDYLKARREEWSPFIAVVRAPSSRAWLPCVSVRAAPVHRLGSALRLRCCYVAISISFFVTRPLSLPRLSLRRCSDVVVGAALGRVQCAKT